MGGTTAICTWFVVDEKHNATYSPQLGQSSDAPEVQRAYWRCIAVFYASSLAVNPTARHLFYSNVRPPTIDGIDMAELFAEWGVECVLLPISWRIPAGKVHAWANQFYIFEILDHLAANKMADRFMLLDNDVIWLKPVARIEPEIDRHGALTYLLDDAVYGPDKTINGLSARGMARFVASHGGRAEEVVPYCGGEFYAATCEATARLAARARELWPEIAEQVPDAPREDGHMFSVLYAIEGTEIGTANGIIRRLWTTFHYHNLSPADDQLTIWHLPAEKKTGFADLFKQLVARPGLHPSRDAARMGLTTANYARLMGWPRRRPVKLVRDLWLKIREKLGR